MYVCMYNMFAKSLLLVFCAIHGFIIICVIDDVVVRYLVFRSWKLLFCTQQSFLHKKRLGISERFVSYLLDRVNKKKHTDFTTGSCDVI